MRLTPTERQAIRERGVDWITNYLSSGGLFNPELAKHTVVRDMLIQFRKDIPRLLDDLDAAYAEVERLRAAYKSICTILGWLNEPPLHVIEEELKYMRNRIHEFAVKSESNRAAMPQGDGT